MNDEHKQKPSAPAVKKFMKPYLTKTRGSMTITADNAQKATQDLLLTFSGVYCQQYTIAEGLVRFSVLSMARHTVYFSAFVKDDIDSSDNKTED